MTRFVLSILIILLPAVGIHAQGKVTVTQSKAIDALVNGKKAPQSDKNMTREERRAAKKAEKERKKQEKAKQKNQKLTVPSNPNNNTSRGDAPKVQVQPGRNPAADAPRITVKEPTKDEARDYKRMVLVRRPTRRQNGSETRTVLRKKKTFTGKGFRILVFSGGNTRDDRTKAEEAGQKVKALLPDLPVYVHFYSPRWMCLIGNFEDYKGAQKALQTVRKAGYKNANIIRKK